MGKDSSDNRIMEHIKVLAEDIGPRGSTSVNEKKAAEYIQSEMKKNGLTVKTDGFVSPATFSWYYAVPNFLIFLSFITYLYQPLAGALLSIIGCFFFFTEINTIETVSRIFPKKESQNVVGKIQKDKGAMKKVVILTHHDTSKPSLSFSPRFIAYFRISILLLIFSASIIPITLVLVFFIGSIGFLLTLLSPFALYQLVSVLVLIHRELIYEPVSGANDNASGTGVLLALCETLSEDPPKNMEIWFLSTGCEEVGTIGMIRFLKKHGKELKDAYFINIDNVGNGNIRYSEREGLIRALSCSKELVDTARKASMNEKIEATNFVSKIYPTNALPCLVRNYKAISILSTDKKGLIYNWHWPTDTYDRLDENTIHRAYELVLEIVTILNGNEINK